MATANIPLSELTVESSNLRKIPEAVFIENIPKFVGQRDAQEVVRSLQDLHSKYQFMLSGLVSQRASVQTKGPDIKESLAMVKNLKVKRDEGERNIQTDYQLADNVYAKADIPLETDKICLWLGANTMLEYSFDEAIELLTNNWANANILLVSLEDDIAFVRDQVTTTEVNIARTHNYGVKQRAEAKDKEGKK